MLPENFSPMLATIAQPFDSPDFIYEIKWDGYRCLAFLESHTRLQSRNRKDITDLFPELRNLYRNVNRSGCLMDGEIVALRDGKPSFLELQKRGQLRQTTLIQKAVRTYPVVYIIFDLLYLDDKPIYQKTWSERRHLLETCLQEDDLFILSSFVPQQGRAYFESVSHLKLEGVVAKAKSSIYIPGKRVKTWYKFKRKLRGHFIICGFTYNQAQQDFLSSFILGCYIGTELQYFGMVGTGFTENEAATMERELRAIVTPDCPFPKNPAPFRGAKQKKIVWTKPYIVCEVEYLELTDEGSLRHPSLKEFCPNLNPAECQYGEES